MRSLLLVLLCAGVSSLAFGQGHPNVPWSLGGFGNVVYPAMGHAPGAPVPVGQFTGVGYSHRFASPGRATHPYHGSTVIVPYPVYYGGYYGAGSYYGSDPSAAGYANGYAPPPDDGSDGGGLPSVVINQNFVPPQANPQVREYTGDQSQQAQPQDQSGMKLYQAPPSHPYADAAAQRAVGSGDKPTIYLIALRDHTIVQALGYWMEGSTLHYVSAEHTLNQVSIDLVDRDLSQRLNDERGLEFHLPPAR